EFDLDVVETDVVTRIENERALEETAFAIGIDVEDDLPAGHCDIAMDGERARTLANIERRAVERDRPRRIDDARPSDKGAVADDSATGTEFAALKGRDASGFGGVCA